MQTALPNDVDLSGDDIVIDWDDGHRGVYPHRYLRLRCQCAGCVDEMTGIPRLDPDTVPEEVMAVDYLTVGNYALQFLWSDAHYSGIYTYMFLRAVCTCPECQSASGGV